MSLNARIKSAHAAAVVHEQAAFAFRQESFAAYQATDGGLGGTPDPVASALYDAGRKAHVAAYEALHALDKLAALIA